MLFDIWYTRNVGFLSSSCPVLRACESPLQMWCTCLLSCIRRWKQ